MLEKRGKKAQATIFIILAIAVVVVGLVVFVLYKVAIIPSSTEGKEITEVRSYINEKTEKATFDIAYLIGKQGGYAILPNKSLITEKKSIAYALYFDQNQLPSKEVVEKQISDYIKSSLIFYLNEDYSLDNNSNLILKDYKINFDWNSLQVETNLEDNSIFVILTLKTKIVSDKNFLLEGYSTKVDSRLGSFLDIADQIVNLKLRNQRIDEKFFSENKVSVEIFPIDSLRTIYSLKSFDKTNNQDYIFNVATIENE